MYVRCLRHVVRKSAFAYFRPYTARFYSTTKTSKPLRILFCGSDDFSIASLRALYEEHKRDPQLIESIDVLCRPGKRVGRALKTIREAPIKAIATELGLTVYERDTFTGWDLPQAKQGPINLLIAVSFGLFVPPRILNSVEYGGLNVHPSLLPKFRGPAPLQHTIMQGETYTGITLQTLDNKSFDHGTILAQTAPRHLEIPDKYNCTLTDLLKFVTPKAADMLVQGIRDRLFVPPLQDVCRNRLQLRLVHAEKTTPAHREVDWAEWSALKVSRYHRALGRLWNNVYIDGTTKKRVVYEDVEIVPTPEVLRTCVDRGCGGEGVHSFTYDRKGGSKVQLYMVDGDAVVIAAPKDGTRCVRVEEMVVEGERRRAAAKVMKGFRDFGVRELSKPQKRKRVRGGLKEGELKEGRLKESGLKEGGLKGGGNVGAVEGGKPLVKGVPVRGELVRKIYYSKDLAKLTFAR